MTTEQYPSIGEVINIKDIDFNMMEYFNRTNRVLFVTMVNGETINTSVGKCYNELVFHGKFPTNLNKKNILSVKIIS